MREIKFRAKSIHTNEWVYGFYACAGYETEIERNVICVSQICDDGFISHFYLADYEIDKNTLGQYTGLKDKNGVEIYEGDILKNIYPQNVFYNSIIDIVEWNEEECSFMLSKGLRHFSETLILEVIGNIYDNKEML